MNKSKGFTLVEILVTFGIISVILLVAIPSVLTIVRGTKSRAYETKKVSILAAAEKYAQNNKDVFGDNLNATITVGTLILTNYIDIDYDNSNDLCDREIGCVLDPRDNSIMNDEIITIKRMKSITQAIFGDVSPSQFLITLNYNGANIGPDRIACITENQNCSVTIPTITREGHNVDIIGWSTNATATTAEVNAGSNIIIDKNNNGTTYYAITSEDLTAKFYKNGADTIDNTSEEIITKICKIYNTSSTCNVAAPSITPSSGKKAVGWNKTQSATTAEYAVGAQIPLNSDTTYYAIQAVVKVTCYKEATYTCPTDMSCSRSGSTCTCTYTGDSWVNFQYKDYCGSKPSGKITCSGGGGRYDRNCSVNGQCEVCPAAGCGILDNYRCRETCRNGYTCDKGGTGGGNSSTCTVIKDATVSCPSGTKVGSYCYLYNQTSCSSGWTQE